MVNFLIVYPELKLILYFCISSLPSNGNLIIANAKDSHEGDYLCQASNGIGSGKSKLVSLFVDGKTS